VETSSLNEKSNLSVKNECPHMFERIFNDEWPFWICLNNNTAILSSMIEGPKFFLGRYWLDLVPLEEDMATSKPPHGFRCFKNPTKREYITISIENIVLICEASDT